MRIDGNDVEVEKKKRRRRRGRRRRRIRRRRGLHNIELEEPPSGSSDRLEASSKGQTPRLQSAT